MSVDMTCADDHGVANDMPSNGWSRFPRFLKFLSDVSPEERQEHDQDAEMDMNSWRSRKMERAAAVKGPPQFESHVDGQETLDIPFSGCDAFASATGVFSYLLDMGLDCFVAAMLFRDKEFWWFGITVFFLVIPSLVITGLSLRWYVADAKTGDYPPVPLWRWILRCLFAVLQMAPVLRFADSAYYGVMCLYSRHKRRYYDLYRFEDADVMMLRIFEAFLEAAPQLVLQLYILARRDYTGRISQPEHSMEEHQKEDFTEIFDIQVETWVVQFISVAFSLISLSWVLASYHRSLRFSLNDKPNMSWIGSILQFIWRIFMITCRVLAIALFASIYPDWILQVLAVHYVICVTWLVRQKSEFTSSKCEEFWYCAIVAFVHMFCFFNIREGRTRYRYTFFYILMYVENIVLISIWYIASDSTDFWYRLPVLLIVTCSFFLGIATMLIFYKFVHPSKPSVNCYRPRTNCTKDVEINDTFCCISKNSETLEHNKSTKDVNEVYQTKDSGNENNQLTHLTTEL